MDMRWFWPLSHLSEYLRKRQESRAVGIQHNAISVLGVGGIQFYLILAGMTIIEWNVHLSPTL